MTKGKLREILDSPEVVLMIILSIFGISEVFLVICLVYSVVLPWVGWR